MTEHFWFKTASEKNAENNRVHWSNSRLAHQKITKNGRNYQQEIDEKLSQKLGSDTSNFFEPESSAFSRWFSSHNCHFRPPGYNDQGKTTEKKFVEMITEKFQRLNCNRSCYELIELKDAKVKKSRARAQKCTSSGPSSSFKRRRHPKTNAQWLKIGRFLVLCYVFSGL